MCSNNVSVKPKNPTVFRYRRFHCMVLVSCELQALVGFVGIVHRCVGRYDLLFPACGSRLVLHLIHSHCVRPDSNYSLSGCVSRATKREQHGSLCKVDRGHSVRR